MEIVIFRHGDSPQIFESKVMNDFERPLSEKGIYEVKKSALNLKKENFSANIIVSSPFKRAVETSMIIKEVLNIKDFLVEDFLKPGSDIEEIIKFIKTQTENIILVGHMPIVGRIAKKFCGGEYFFPCGSYLRIYLKEHNNAYIISQYLP
ncbi:MAG: histidine phosphatase family protein [Elusimicrobiota bacterium]